MTIKFHINPATGDVAICHATKRPCIYGGDEQHGATREEAQIKYEESMRGKSEKKLYKIPRQRKNGFTPTANPEQAKAMRLLGRSSAASPFDNRPKRQRTRLDAKKAALRDQS